MCGFYFIFFRHEINLLCSRQYIHNNNILYYSIFVSFFVIFYYYYHHRSRRLTCSKVYGCYYSDFVTPLRRAKIFLCDTMATTPTEIEWLQDIMLSAALCCLYGNASGPNNRRGPNNVPLSRGRPFISNPPD